MNRVTICGFCKQDTAETKGCAKNPVVGHNQRWDRIPYGKEVDEATHPFPGFCSGCNVSLKAYHHALCPVEECPRCNGKMNICQCFYTLKEE